MPSKKRRTRKKPESDPVSAPEAFRPKRKRRTARPPRTAEPVAVASTDNAPKTLMQRIFENQRAELNEGIQKFIFLVGRVFFRLVELSGRVRQ